MPKDEVKKIIDRYQVWLEYGKLADDQPLDNEDAKDVNVDEP